MQDSPSSNRNPLPEGAFKENGPIEPAQLNELYRLVGWDRSGRRTVAETEEMLRVSRYYIAAHIEGQLVGFARVCGDPYVAQVLDVITHPSYRLRGVATRCMKGVVGHLEQSRYISVTLTDGTSLPQFYERFGFRQISSETPSRVWRPETPPGAVI